ncbi:type VI secretion system baseplate subunit TssG [Alphaproteobacteria bacterium endosymbiont of Tiliacea citrago]|uniref:type VI secretion system baseplate subunit TssG n=1 Tax=Alphaproteobacteria bacterium endosymbiont of Tiliacea citrago TaxID=3077944 RepID=UPI00313A7847
MNNNALHNLYQSLLDKPYHFSFFQACFLLEKIHQDKHKFASGFAFSEPIRLVPYIHASTPHSSCIKFNSLRNTFHINSPALIGFNGVLPSFYAETIFFQEKQNNFYFSDFFNIFHHRYYSLKYKLEKKYTQTLQNREKAFSEAFNICGLSNFRYKKQFTPFLSVLTMKNKSKEGLKNLLEGLLKINIDICEFQEKWFDIPKKHQLKIDRSPLVNKALGSQTKVHFASIKIIFWFENFEKYIEYLDNENKQKEIKDVIKYFLNGELEYNIQLKIKKAPSKTFNFIQQNRLGLTTWI